MIKNNCPICNTEYVWDSDLECYKTVVLGDLAAFNQPIETEPVKVNGKEITLHLCRRCSVNGVIAISVVDGDEIIYTPSTQSL